VFADTGPANVRAVSRPVMATRLRRIGGPPVVRPGSSGT
jgi:hypothetical protein